MQGDSRAPGKRSHTSLAKRAEDVDNMALQQEVKDTLLIDAGTKVNADSAVFAPPATATTATADNEEEEEKLLRNAEPDDGKRVIDEDEGVRSEKKSASAKPSTAPVSVRVASTPKGAVVKLGNRVFGRAPMNLRFRPGITFELTFVKKGYEPATKRFTPTAQKKQTIKAVLKRKSPAPKKSILERIFGRKY